MARKYPGRTIYFCNYHGVPFSPLGNTYDRLRPRTVARESDRLGWDSFLEGRITSLWLSMVLPMLCKSLHSLLPPSWGRQLINKLHNIVHKQWIYRNTCIHYRGTDGFTMPEHNKIINRVEEYSLIDPKDLLP
jgi:hypothetical protein